MANSAPRCDKHRRAKLYPDRLFDTLLTHTIVLPRAGPLLSLAAATVEVTRPRARNSRMIQSQENLNKHVNTHRNRQLNKPLKNSTAVMETTSKRRLPIHDAVP